MIALRRMVTDSQTLIFILLITREEEHIIFAGLFILRQKIPLMAYL
jgi:hypothetical protein